MVLTNYNQVTSWSSSDELKTPSVLSLGDSSAISNSIWEDLTACSPSPLIFNNLSEMSAQKLRTIFQPWAHGKSAPNSHSLIPLLLFPSITQTHFQRCHHGAPAPLPTSDVHSHGTAASCASTNSFWFGGLTFIHSFFNNWPWICCYSNYALFEWIWFIKEIRWLGLHYPRCC